MSSTNPHVCNVRNFTYRQILRDLTGEVDNFARASIGQHAQKIHSTRIEASSADCHLQIHELSIRATIRIMHDPHGSLHVATTTLWPAYTASNTPDSISANSRYPYHALAARGLQHRIPPDQA